MVSHLAEELQGMFNTDIFVREFSAGYGIADLVFARSFRSTNELDRSPIKNYYSLVLYLGLAKDIEFTKNDALHILQVGPSTAQTAINELVISGYIERTSYSNYKKILESKTDELKLVAIEAKLHDWKHGIMQARRYKAFTDESYLAIFSKYEKNIDKDLLEQHDIGLILVNESDGAISFSRKPKGTHPAHLRQIHNTTYAAELFLASTFAQA